MLRSIFALLALSLVACGQKADSGEVKDTGAQNLAQRAVDPAWNDEAKAFFMAGCEYETKLQSTFVNAPWSDSERTGYCACVYDGLVGMATVAEYFAAPMKWYGELYAKGFQEKCLTAIGK